MASTSPCIHPWRRGGRAVRRYHQPTRERAAQNRQFMLCNGQVPKKNRTEPFLLLAFVSRIELNARRLLGRVPRQWIHRSWLPRRSRTAPGSMTWTRRRPFRSLPRPASPLQPNACTKTELPSCPSRNTTGAHRSQKTASSKFRDHGAPGCHLSDESLQAFRSKHGYNNYDPDADKFYARERSQRSWPI